MLFLTRDLLLCPLPLEEIYGCEICLTSDTSDTSDMTNYFKLSCDFFITTALLYFQAMRLIMACSTIRRHPNEIENPFVGKTYFITYNVEALISY